MANAWTYPLSVIPPQNEWGMSSGQEQQWQPMPGSTAAGSGDQWSMRAWTSQDSTQSWSTESTVSAKVENRETRTVTVGALAHQRKVPIPPPIQAKTSSQTQETNDPPPGGPSAGGGRRTTPNPKKPADDAWKN
eukprot:3963647-Amphidinium_carterae.1